MRLRTRRKVDLPQPDGPINAITERSGMVSVTSKSACDSPYQKFSPRTSNFGLALVTSRDPRPTLLRSEMIAE
jgi:hypothetical protein